MSKNIGVILAGGIGARFHGNIPKQYMKLNGKEIITYSIEAFREAKKIDEFLCVVNEDEFINKNIKEKYNVKCIKGGSSRNESLANALSYINEMIPDCKKVFIHEAARPFIKGSLIDKYLDLLDENDAVITAAKVTDSLGYVDGNIADRGNFLLIQAPEAFDFQLLRKHFDAKSSITATVHQLPSGVRIYNYYDFKFNLKVTYPEDLFIAEQLIKLKYYDRNHNFLQHKLRISRKKALILGASGGVGSVIKEKFKELNVNILSPTREEIDLETVTVEALKEYCKDFKPDIIINAAAFSAKDDAGLVAMFDKLFSVNLKSNLVLMEFAVQLNKKVNLVLFSSSSSTRGRKDIALYSAAKVGINSLVESLANKMQEQGVYINAIIPEKINTPMIQKLHDGKVNERELLDVEYIMDAVVFYATTDTFGDLIHIRKGL
ncbi:MAG TPA: SDR family NAD(P)-dependent oxidoreductase [Candidatus Cloacimonadota bacterium]|jgi:2-C-methyl-D-erythritol 4-phosphate cytidylyltransferase|nr:SDR family NAD(P)-dependent oxidoreductase [Candidatus Cloacimonadales bacterium]HPY97290.1 SDR family NAD(P)-dependent oxidoreductase [Candidatus Cloacimonadota bacterium]HQB41823.1 SDR family NAD(P)-dependent oxidoreductase [Candidatus Cloacimonadota bacterium]